MNRFISKAFVLILLAAVFVCCAPFAAKNEAFVLCRAASEAIQGSCGENAVYSYSGGTITVSGSGKMSPSSGDIQWAKLRTKATKAVIGQGITEIDKNCFYKFTKLREVKLPDTLQLIGDFAFFGCKNIEELSVPFGVKKIGSYVFKSCTKLASLTLPDSIESIGSGIVTETALRNDPDSWIDGLLYIGNHLIRAEYTPKCAVRNGTRVIAGSAFKNCGVQSVFLPESIVFIGERAFLKNGSLKNITLPDSIKEIGEQAFACCTSLESVTLPKSAEFLGKSAFEGCERLSGAVFSGKLTAVPEKCFFGCSSLCELTLPQGITEIGADAFNGCPRLAELVLPDGLRSVGEQAFYGCSGLRKLTLPESLQSIGTFAFRNAAISALTVPSGIEKIGDGAFYNCAKLQTLTLSEGLKHIGGSSFCGCTALKEILLPESLQEVGGGAFENCTGIGSVTLPAALCKVGGGAFKGCSALAALSIRSDHLVISPGAFENTPLMTDEKNYRDGFLCVDGHILAADPSLRGEVTLPDGTKSIAGEAFEYRTGITRLILSDSVYSVGEKAFSCCASLTEITIPTSVRVLGKDAFIYCGDLKKIVYGGCRTEWNALSENCSTQSAEVVCDPDISDFLVSVTNNASKTQTVTLTYTGSSALAAYYFGKEPPEGKEDYKTLSSDKSTIQKKVKDSGTYYYSLIDKKGFVSHTGTLVFYKTILTNGYEPGEVGCILTLKGNTAAMPGLTRSGCDLYGWEDQNGRTFKEYTPTRDDTLHAVWKNHKHSFIVTGITPATTKKEGYKHLKCSGCGAVSAKLIKSITTVKLSQKKFVYNGKTVTPGVKVKAQQSSLKKDRDYTLKYSSGRKKPGIYKVTVTFKGNYSGKVTLKFKIVPKTPAFQSLTPYKGRAVLKWKAVTGATGYEIYYYSTRSGKYVKDGITSKTSYDFTDLAGGKTYKVKLRAYTTVGSEKVLSDFSGVKKVTAK